MCKLSKEQLYEQVYTPMKELKDRFYAAETPEIWEECKGELIELLTKAETVMDKDWYEKWKQSQFDSITKMHTYKVKYWERGKEKKTYPVKSSYIFREEEGKAFIELCNAMSYYLNLKCNV